MSVFLSSENLLDGVSIGVEPVLDGTLDDVLGR